MSTDDQAEGDAMTGEIVVMHPAAELMTADVPALMAGIRPQWQAKGLIERVRRLLPVDPSSACQRLLNATIQDLREKILLAGLDIAKEAAVEHRLPVVSRADDIDNYSTSKIIELSYRMGLLSRAEWRRLTRAYEIRRDLEHEDSEYEAGVEDALYVFKVCIESVLSKDPVSLIKVAEVKSVIEAAGPVVADAGLVDDFEHAPDPRQLEILSFLVATALEDKSSELVRENASTLLSSLGDATRNSVRVQLAERYQSRLGRNSMTELQARVAHSIGVLPYLRKPHRLSFFTAYLDAMNKVGHNWRAHASHGALLRTLNEVGGFSAMPEEIIPAYTRWVTLCFIGEPGGYGAGTGRKVFFSNTAAPVILDLIKSDADIIRTHLKAVQDDRDVRRAISMSEAVGRRYELLLDLVE